MNAIYDAVGVRITSLPATPEKVLEAIRKKKGTNERVAPPVANEAPAHAADTN